MLDLGLADNVVLRVGSLGKDFQPIERVPMIV
jgi:hypothetical protein